MAMHHQLELPGERQDLGEAAAGLTDKRRLESLARLTDKRRLESLARPIITRLYLITEYNVIISTTIM